MSSPFVAEIRPWALNFAPRGWALAQGQILPISQYTRLFSLIGTYYGGNGTTNFQLPNMVGMVTNSQGTGPGLQPRDLGQSLGAATVNLTAPEMASHTHALQLGAAAAAGAAPGPGTASDMAAINPAFNGFVAPP